MSSTVSAVNPVLRGFNPDPSIVRVKDDYYTSYRSDPVTVPEGPVYLRMQLDGPDLACEWSGDGESWTVIGGVLPAWTLSDNHGERLRFTGAFIGVRAEDLDPDGWHADFDHVTVHCQRQSV